MADNIPFDIQLEIIKKVCGVKSLVRLRPVSKEWKAFIDSSEFIKGYGANMQPHSHILSYNYKSLDEEKYICLVDDDIKTLKVQQEFAPLVLSPLLTQYNVYNIVGVCHGLLCLYGFHQGYKERMLVIWNPSIGKSFTIAVHNFSSEIYGFGVCPVTKDPTVVNIIQTYNKPSHAMVYTLSSRVWKVVPTRNLSIRLDNPTTQVVIDRFIYWGAYEETFDDDGQVTRNCIVLSFDLITQEFKVVDLLDNLKNELYRYVRVSNLRESLVVYGSLYVNGAECCGVWVMERDSSFKKLFTIGAPVRYILGFSKSGEPIFEIQKKSVWSTTLGVYNPCSQQIKSLGISGVKDSFFMGSYKESLLLLDHSDSD